MVSVTSLSLKEEYICMIRALFHFEVRQEVWGIFLLIIKYSKCFMSIVRMQNTLLIFLYSPRGLTFIGSTVF